jgi:hypothetical protein
LAILLATESAIPLARGLVMASVIL